MKKTLRFDGGTIEYELKRKRVKNLNLRLRSDGTVAVSAPYFVPQAQIDRFVLRHAGRILESLEKLRQRESNREDSSGFIYLYGKPVELRLVSGGKNSAAFTGEHVLLTVRDINDSSAREKALNALLRQIAIERVSDSCRRIFPIFAAMGVKEPELKFRRMKSRWGSCRYEKGSLSFNTALAHVPEACLDYVVMHEFCHFIRPDHSPAFHALMTELMPDWKARKKLLSEYSSFL